MLTRRYFVKGAALALAGVGGAPGWLARAASGKTGSRRKVLVAIFQRGAMDGLSAVVPYGEKRYYDLRPALAIPRPGASDGCIDLDGFFGLNPMLRPLAELYEQKQLAVVEAAGSPDETRSHFDAQDYMESGTPGRKATADGWMNRALVPAKDASPVRAVSMGPQLARALRGRQSAVAINTLAEFRVRGDGAASAFERMYGQSSDPRMTETGRETFEAIELVRSMEKQRYVPSNGARYPSGRLGKSLEQIARLVKAGVGLEAAFADTGGWDTHANQPNPLNLRLRELGEGLAAFHRDLGEAMEDIVVVTMSEFGRTVRENGNRGTDHGHANVMFALGGAVEGGRIHGRWPGLEEEQLWQGRDLAVTTDFRDVLGEVVANHLGNRRLEAVFPGYAVKPVGLLKG